MRWAWKVGRVAGIEIRIHATFLLLLAWIGMVHYLAGHTWQAAVLGMLFILAVFGTIVLHELGHALTAKRFGIRTFDITLLPIGGIARLERIPERPLHEFLIAMAGPAVNLALAAILLALLGSSAGPPDVREGINTPTAFLSRMAWVNVGLALFNLLPAFPMDGGRAFRAILASRLGPVAATQAAGRLGQGMALVFGFLGLLFNPVLALIALFVWISASEEVSATQFKAGIEGIPVHQAMLTEFHVLAPDDPLALPMAYLTRSLQHDYPVLDGGRLQGVLTHKGLLEALAQHGEAAPVSCAMETHFETLDPNDLLINALPRLHASHLHAMPVVLGQQVVGLLSFESFGEMLMIHGALHKHQ